MTDFRALAEAALDSNSAFGWIPQAKHGGPFLVAKDRIILGRLVRAGVRGIPGTGERMYDAFDMTGRHLGCHSGLWNASQAIETELCRRRAAGDDWLTGVREFKTAEIGA